MPSPTRHDLQTVLLMPSERDASRDDSSLTRPSPAEGCRRPIFSALLASSTMAALFIIFFLPSTLRLPPISQLQSAINSGSSCPRSIWLIRHGEKTIEPIAGSPEVLELNATGRERARYLRALVSRGDWPRFTHIFATAPSPVLRELQTVEPIAQELGVEVDLRFGPDGIEGLASAALSEAGTCGAVVLISFEHCRIPQLLMQLGCMRAACTACWPDGSYDSFVVLRSQDDGGWFSSRHDEGFRADVDGFDDYECGRPPRLQHTRCQRSNGSWLGG